MADEERLLRRARAYEQAALEELYDAYAPLIYSYIYRRIQDAASAEDLTGEVFLRMLQALRSDGAWHTSFRGWLYRVAHNLVVDYYRRQPATPPVSLDDEIHEIEADGDGPETLAQASASRRALREALQQLTPEQQQVLALRFGQELATREVSQILGKSVSAVEGLQHRALAALRRIIKDEAAVEWMIDE